MSPAARLRRAVPLIALVAFVGLGLWMMLASPGSDSEGSGDHDAPVVSGEADDRGSRGSRTREDPGPRGARPGGSGRSGDVEGAGEDGSRVGAGETAGAAAAPDDGTRRETVPAHLSVRARELAAAAVEAIRDDVHREKMNIVWPESVPAGPPDGAEMLILRGYRYYRMTRIGWSAGVADGMWISTKGADEIDDSCSALPARTFTASPDDFVAAWIATQLVLGARAERKEPIDPANLGGMSFGGGSHESYLWIRLREDASAPGALHAASQRGESRGPDAIREWDQIRDRAMFALVEALLPENGGAEVPASVWAPRLNAVLTELNLGRDLDWDGTDRLLLKVVLRTIGDAGDHESLKLVGTMLDRLRAATEQQIEHKRAILAARAALRRLELRLRWDATRADELLLEPRAPFGDIGFPTWLRQLYAQRDPEGYRATLLRHAEDDELSEYVRRGAINKIQHRFGEDGIPTLRGLLDDDSAHVRVDAAMALDLLGDHRDALRVLEQVASDTTLRSERPILSRTWPRWLAIEHLLREGRWDIARAGRQMRAPGEDGRVIAFLEAFCVEQGAPLTVAVRREIYRGVLDGRKDGGMIAAIEILVELDDRPSWERMRKLVAEMQAPAPAGTQDLVDTWHRRRTLPELAEKLAR